MSEISSFLKLLLTFGACIGPVYVMLIKIIASQSTMCNQVKRMEANLDKSVERIDNELKELHKHDARIDKIMLAYDVVASDIKTMKCDMSTHKIETRNELDLIKSECMQRVGVIDILMRIEKNMSTNIEKPIA